VRVVTRFFCAGQSPKSKEIRLTIRVLFFVEDKFKSLFLIELEFMVTGYEGHPVSNSMGNDDMVRRVFVVFC
jgi:hypothetical protein